MNGRSHEAPVIIGASGVVGGYALRDALQKPAVGRVQSAVARLPLAQWPTLQCRGGCARQRADERILKATTAIICGGVTIMTEFDLTPPSSAQRDAIIAGLTAMEHDVLLEHGTEAAFCGVFLDNHKDGVYTCRFCGLPLFRSSAKFDSGTGWPSFFKPYNEAHIRRVRDTSYGMVRVEEVCARCGSHLGHVFPDGPPPSGERHCLNSVSLSFIEQGEALPDVLGRGPPEGQVLA
jgi:peptide-methionine (R)-S-oxide reductase